MLVKNADGKTCDGSCWPCNVHDSTYLIRSSLLLRMLLKS